MKILNNKISIDNPPFIIAEISGNHKGSIKRAFNIIKKAKEIGASAVKLQTFDLNEMTVNSKKKILLLMIKPAHGTKKIFMNFIKLPKLQKNGIKKYLNIPKKLELYALVQYSI